MKVCPIHVDVGHVTTNVNMKHCNEISLCQTRILSAPVTRLINVSTYVKKSRMVDCRRIISFDASKTVDPDPMDAFIFMIFVFNFTMIFIFCPILIFRSSLFIVNSILTFYRYCFYFIYTDIAYMIYYNFLMVLTNSLSDIPSKLGSCFYVFQTMFLTVNFLHPTENLIQWPFQQAGDPFLWIMVLLYNFETQLRS